MFPEISALTTLINRTPSFKLLISRIQKSDDDFWLVGGCLRNSLLHLPQVDIDIACSGDPTPLAQAWGEEVSGHWFWLDAKRRQSRVLSPSGLSFDFSPLRAASITADLQLRDFTINALALPLNEFFPDSEFLDPLAGVSHLQQKQLQSCSPRSFLDDPLRMLKGIRHAVTLGFTLSDSTQKQMISSKHLLANIAGERIRDELSKIFDSKNIIKGIELLVDTELLGALFGSAGSDWNKQTAIDAINRLEVTLHDVGQESVANISNSRKPEVFSNRAIFLLTQFLKHYSSSGLAELLQRRLRLSRQQQRLIKELLADPSLDILSLAPSIEGQRPQALLVEKQEPFSAEKMFYWGVCENRLTLERTLQLQKSFARMQKFGRVPNLLNGREISSLLGSSSNIQIGKWQSRLKLAEINGEITTKLQAENWLKSKLPFDNQEA
ncbi:MAG: hypothetical protein QM483_08010 [Desulfuromusa sp.]